MDILAIKKKIRNRRKKGEGKRKPSSRRIMLEKAFSSVNYRWNIFSKGSGGVQDLDVYWRKGGGGGDRDARGAAGLLWGIPKERFFRGKSRAEAGEVHVWKKNGENEGKYAKEKKPRRGGGSFASKGRKNGFPKKMSNGYKTTRGEEKKQMRKEEQKGGLVKYKYKLILMTRPRP